MSENVRISEYLYTSSMIGKKQCCSLNWFRLWCMLHPYNNSTKKLLCLVLAVGISEPLYYTSCRFCWMLIVSNSCWFYNYFPNIFTKFHYVPNIFHYIPLYSTIQPANIPPFSTIFHRSVRPSLVSIDAYTL